MSNDRMPKSIRQHFLTPAPSVVPAVRQATQREIHHPAVQALALRIANAMTYDEANGGCDLSAGMFGTAMSALIVDLACPKPYCRRPLGHCQCKTGSATQQGCQDWVTP